MRRARAYKPQRSQPAFVSLGRIDIVFEQSVASLRGTVEYPPFTLDLELFRGRDRFGLARICSEHEQFFDCVAGSRLDEFKEFQFPCVEELYIDIEIVAHRVEYRLRDQLILRPEIRGLALDNSEKFTDPELDLGLRAVEINPPVLL